MIEMRNPRKVKTVVGDSACFWLLVGEDFWGAESVESGGMSSLFVQSDRRRGRVAVFLLRFFEGFNGMTGVSQYV